MKGGARQHAELFDVLVELHVLHAASKEEITSQGVADKLNRRGYKISSRSALLLLRSLEAKGWLRSREPGQSKGLQFRSTHNGQKILREFRPRIAALVKELSGVKPAKSG